MSDLGADSLRVHLGPSVSVVSERHWGDDAWERLSAYCEQLSVWNQRINLTAARTADEIRRQVEECLPLLPHLPDGLAEVPGPDVGAAPPRVVDVGAGGGLPGLVLAAFLPELEWTLVEPIRKKHAFLRAAARAMQIRPDCRAVREETLEAAAFDVALTRATWAMPEWLERGRRLVREGGAVLGLEGKERLTLPADAERVTYELGGRARTAVVLRV